MSAIPAEDKITLWVGLKQHIAKAQIELIR